MGKKQKIEKLGGYDGGGKKTIEFSERM